MRLQMQSGAFLSIDPLSRNKMFWAFLMIFSCLTIRFSEESSDNQPVNVKPTTSTAPHHRLLGRHVCVQNKVVARPIKHVETYCKPVYKTYMYVCDKEKYRLCTSFRVAYEKAYRTVQKIATQTETLYVCCPGWSQTLLGKHDCTKALCSQNCKNGGKCNKPDHCLCPVGWTGKSCETDVNECANEGARCDHLCVNTPGSYRCNCHEGFILQPDGRHCKINLGTFPEYQEFVRGYQELTRKVIQLEKVQQNYNMTDITQRIDALSESVDSLRKAPRSPYDVTDSEESPLDRINSLSDQIAMLEERLGSCACNSDFDGASNFVPHG